MDYSCHDVRTERARARLFSIIHASNPRGKIVKAQGTAKYSLKFAAARDGLRNYISRSLTDRLSQDLPTIRIA